MNGLYSKHQRKLCKIVLASCFLVILIRSRNLSTALTVSQLLLQKQYKKLIRHPDKVHLFS